MDLVHVHEALTSLHFPIHETVGVIDQCQWDILYQPIQFPNLRQIHFDLKHGNAVGSLPLLDSSIKDYLPKLEAIRITTPQDAPFEIPSDVRGIMEKIVPLIVNPSPP
jgi:hypothetical protein